MLRLRLPSGLLQPSQPFRLRRPVLVPTVAWKAAEAMVDWTVKAVALAMGVGA